MNVFLRYKFILLLIIKPFKMINNLISDQTKEIWTKN